MRTDQGTVYLDWNATTPPHPSVVAACQKAMEQAWANPASVHGMGRAARAHVEDARDAVASLVGRDPRDVTLTSGGTEANNLALLWAFPPGSPGALVVSRAEHPSVTRTAEMLQIQGVHVEWVSLPPTGRVDPAAVAEAIGRAQAVAPVRLVSLQAVNHETGILQPVEAVAELVHAARAKLHVDAVQAVGKTSGKAWAAADLVTLAAHKIRGPKGVGAVVVQPGLRLRPLLGGGEQERGARPGTQDAAVCAGFAVAAQRAISGPLRYAALEPLRDHLERELFALGEAASGRPIRNGDGPRAPHVSNLSWPGWRNDELCAALDLAGVAVASGSACSAGTAEPSPVIEAMVGRERARSAVRVSLGDETTQDDVDEALRRWRPIVIPK